MSSPTFWPSTSRERWPFAVKKNDGAQIGHAACAGSRRDRVARGPGSRAADAQAARYIRAAPGSPRRHCRSVGKQIAEATCVAHHHRQTPAGGRREQIITTATARSVDSIFAARPLYRCRTALGIGSLFITRNREEEKCAAHHFISPFQVKAACTPVCR